MGPYPQAFSRAKDCNEATWSKTPKRATWVRVKKNMCAFFHKQESYKLKLEYKYGCKTQCDNCAILLAPSELAYFYFILTPASLAPFRIKIEHKLTNLSMVLLVKGELSRKKVGILSYEPMLYCMY